MSAHPNLSTGIVSIHGREYKTVALRVSEFREKYPDWMIMCDIIQNDEVIIVKATISDSNGMPRATGYAEELRGSTNINKTSALENCETSAVGRALAFLGFAGSEIASANEITQEQLDQAFQMGLNKGKAIGLLNSTIETVKNGIANDDLSSASEAWNELSNEEKMSIWLAPSKGGPFTTIEREIIKSAEFRKAHFG